LSRAHAMRDTNGVLRIWIGSNTDVDDMKRAEEALRQKTVEAQEASLIKSRFVSNVSHELRTPLNVILGYSALLAQGLYGALSHEQKGPLSGIQRNANDLLHLVNDILDLARMEGRKLPTRQEPLNLDLLLKEVVAGMKPFLEKKALDVQWLLPEALPLMESDAGKIKQIFTNILSNAIKFTPEGQITIAVRDRPKKNGIEVGIQDTGIGIKPEELAKIFDAFHQADAGMTREFGGVGLGLTIVKELVHLLEGEMTVESEYTKGSTFTLFFPYRIS
jgi:signal transduction histidine kinase